MTTPTPQLALIEPYAHRIGGHYQRTLHALAAAHPGCLVITPADLEGTTARVLAACAAVLGPMVGAAGRLWRPGWWPDPMRRIPHQLRMIHRCLIEAACLRTAARRCERESAVVVLTASETLHTLAAVLGGRAHLRFVHEVDTTEDLPLRLLGQLARRGESRIGLLCPTEAVRHQVTGRFPRLPTLVRTYAVDDGDRLTASEISGARAIFGISAEARVVCLVGGWWAHKDIAVINAALHLLRRPVHLLVTGDPIDQMALERWRDLPQVQLHVEPGPLPEWALRLVYAAADASLVARRAGVGKESGLVLGAARLGVPLIVSDHDPDLTGQLADTDWARPFPAGDPAQLAAVLDQLADAPLPRPPTSAPKTLRMPTATEQAAFLTATHRQLFGDHR